MRHVFLAIVGLFLFNLPVSSQMEIVEIRTPSSAKAVAGVVVDPSGAVLPGVTVEDRSEDWKIVLRSTETDHTGRFHFSSSQKKTVYYLQFSRSGFNWLRITLRLDKKAEAAIVVKMPIGT